MVAEAMRAAWLLKEEHDIETRVLNVHTVKPFDVAALAQAAEQTQAIVTAEEHQVGGFGNIIAGAILRHRQNYEQPLLFDMVGVGRVPVEFATVQEVRGSLDWATMRLRGSRGVPVFVDHYSIEEWIGAPVLEMLHRYDEGNEMWAQMMTAEQVREAQMMRDGYWRGPDDFRREYMGNWDAEIKYAEPLPDMEYMQREIAAGLAVPKGLLEDDMKRQDKPTTTPTGRTIQDPWAELLSNGQPSQPLSRQGREELMAIGLLLMLAKMESEARKEAEPKTFDELASELPGLKTNHQRLMEHFRF
jgi:hypothetical protein